METEQRKRKSLNHHPCNNNSTKGKRHDDNDDYILAPYDALWSTPLTHQSLVRGIGVRKWVWSVHSQGHTVCKDCQQNQVLKWPVFKITLREKDLGEHEIDICTYTLACTCAKVRGDTLIHIEAIWATAE